MNESDSRAAAASAVPRMSTGGGGGCLPMASRQHHPARIYTRMSVRVKKCLLHPQPECLSIATYTQFHAVPLGQAVMFIWCQKHFRRAQVYQKKSADRKRQPVTFKEGQQAWLRSQHLSLDGIPSVFESTGVWSLSDFQPGMEGQQRGMYLTPTTRMDPGSHVSFLRVLQILCRRRCHQ